MRLVGTGQDVTERKQADLQRRELEEEQSARRQAEAASQLKDEFLAIVSHELRTPLNAILGWAHMLSVGSLDRAGSAKALQIIERNAIMQARLIDDLLDVSRFATNQAFVHAAPVAIASIVRTAVDTIEPVAASRRISLTLSVDDADVVVEGDSARLQQVVSNLLSNALKFTPEGGEYGSSWKRRRRRCRSPSSTRAAGSPGAADPGLRALLAGGYDADANGRRPRARPGHRALARRSSRRRRPRRERRPRQGRPLHRAVAAVGGRGRDTGLRPPGWLTADKRID